MSKNGGLRPVILKASTNNLLLYGRAAHEADDLDANAEPSEIADGLSAVGLGWILEDAANVGLAQPRLPSPPEPAAADEGPSWNRPKYQDLAISVATM